MENNLTPVEWLVKQYEQKFGEESSHLMRREILEALLMEGREMVKYCNLLDTSKIDVIDAYNAGYEDATCNHINDAEQYYHQKYSHDSSRKSQGTSTEIP